MSPLKSAQEAWGKVGLEFEFGSVTFSAMIGYMGIPTKFCTVSRSWFVFFSVAKKANGTVTLTWLLSSVVVCQGYWTEVLLMGKQAATHCIGLAGAGIFLFFQLCCCMWENYGIEKVALIYSGRECAINFLDMIRFQKILMHMMKETRNGS